MDDIELVGVSTIGADCYLEPSVSASCKIINRFSNKSLQVAPSYERGANPFQRMENACILYGCVTHIK